MPRKLEMFSELIKRKLFFVNKLLLTELLMKLLIKIGGKQVKEFILHLKPVLGKAEKTCKIQTSDHVNHQNCNKRLHFFCKNII